MSVHIDGTGRNGYLSLREAAEAVGTSKSTLFRAIRAGRISATRDDDGQFRIDPAELFRVYPPADLERSAPMRATPQVMTQDATPSDAGLQVRCASLEAEVQGLKAMVEELRRTRDKWEAQAERLALAPPTPVTVTMPERRPWWRRTRGVTAKKSPAQWPGQSTGRTQGDVSVSHACRGDNARHGL